MDSRPGLRAIAPMTEMRPCGSAIRRIGRLLKVSGASDEQFIMRARKPPSAKGAAFVVLGRQTYLRKLRCRKTNGITPLQVPGEPKNPPLLTVRSRNCRLVFGQNAIADTVCTGSITSKPVSTSIGLSWQSARYARSVTAFWHNEPEHEPLELDS